MRIGHIKLTRAHLLEESPPQMCMHYSIPITIHRTLIIFSRYHILRIKFKLPDTLNDVLMDIDNSVDRLFQFLRIARLLE